MKQHILLILSLLFSLSSCGNYEATLQNDTLTELINNLTKLFTLSKSLNYNSLFKHCQYMIEINYKNLKIQALEIAKSYLISSFKASNSFLKKFQSRNRLVMRKGTHIIQKETDLIYQKLEVFLKNLKDIKFNYANSIFDDSTAEDLIFVNMV